MATRTLHVALPIPICASMFVHSRCCECPQWHLCPTLWDPNLFVNKQKIVGSSAHSLNFIQARAEKKNAKRYYYYYYCTFSSHGIVKHLR